MAEVMKYEDFKEGGSEAAVKVSSQSFSSAFFHVCHFSILSLFFTGKKFVMLRES